MVAVAVAGGTGSVGRAIVKAIAGTGKHDILVLTRNSTTANQGHSAPTQSSNDTRVSFIKVDYTSPDTISHALNENNAHTVICCLDINTEASHEAQMSLIRAAANSNVKRFAPSEFAVDYLIGKSLFPSAAFKIRALELLKTTDLEYTRFMIGTFMDYFAPPGIPTTLRTMNLVLDHAAHKAVIPGDGNTPVVVTLLDDVAKFIAASLELKWRDPSVIVGDRLTLNEMVALAEEAHQAKFDVAHDTIEDLGGGRITELSPNAKMPPQMVKMIRRAAGLAMATGQTNLATPTLNEALPQMTTTSVKDLFTKYIKA